VNLLLVDQDGVGLAYAWRALAAGHTVKWFIQPKPSNNQQSGNGFKGIEKIDNWVPAAKWADLIICTSNDKYLERLDFMRKQGLPVFAPTPESATLEISRQAGMEALEKAGIKTAPYKTFPNVDAALKHVEKTEERFVFKTLGDNEDKALTYVSKSPADMIAWIERMIEHGNQPKGAVMLQQFIDGIEMGVSRFMGSKGFVGPWNESFEHKKMMPSNYGCNTGEMGTIAYFTKESKLGADTLSKFEDMLMKLGHTGDAALGFIIDKDGTPWPTEWTMRFGWPIANMMLGATEGDPIQWMKDALEGKDTTTFKEDIGCCLVLAHADFPHGQKTKSEVSGVPIYGLTKGNKKHIQPQAVKIDILPDMDGEKVIRRPVWNTAGDYVAVVNGFGKNVNQATDRAYKTMKQLHVANMIVRDDIGETLKEQLPKLHALGYATHCDYEESK
jgi:phosphoribosylamine--glycine ligase